MSVRFGPAGCPESFYAAGHKSTIEMPEWLNELGLDAFEVQCGRGVKFSDESARRIGENAVHFGVQLSVHAPYYINISTTDADKRENGINYVMQTLHVARIMRAKRIVVHMGSFAGSTREAAVEVSKDFMRECLEHSGDILICPETMGKINQMGTVDEVLELCSIDERLMPTLDFGHINSRQQGIIDYEEILDRYENRLGRERLVHFHAHFSKIEYTKGGERRHLTFEDTVYGPEFEPLAHAIAKRRLEPVIICESDGRQTEDALTMQKIYGDVFRDYGDGCCVGRV